MVEVEKIDEYTEMYRGSDYLVKIFRGYVRSSYRVELDSVYTQRLSDEKDWAWVPWFYFEDTSLPFLNTEADTEDGFIGLLKRTTPEGIDEIARAIQDCEESLSYAGLEFA